MPQAKLPREADAVFEGGGVKGVALVGAVAAAERAGVEEWKNVAGTSAGAIVAALLAAGYRGESREEDAGETKSLREILDDVVYTDFPDYGRGGRVRGILWNQLWARGLAPGEFFVRWLDGWLDESPVAKKLQKKKLTFGDLVRDDLPSDLTEGQRARARYRLRVIASDISGARMLVLPTEIEGFRREDGTEYDADSLGVAEAVRMSMSYPYLFRPAVLRGRDGRPHYVVDGGLLSNFPVWLFDTTGDRPPARPTWGFRLHGGKTDLPQEDYHGVPMPFWRHKLAVAMFQAATQAWDTRHVTDTTSVRTVNIGTRDISTTNFKLTKKEREDLFDWGVEAAERFFASDTARAHVEPFHGRAAARD